MSGGYAENVDTFILEKNHQRNVLRVTILGVTSSSNAKNIKGHFFEKSVSVRKEDCILCMVCVTSCPTQAITVEE